MDVTKTLLSETDIFSLVYKSAKLGTDAIISLLPKVKSQELRSHMAKQLDGYERHAVAARHALERMGAMAKEENLLQRTSNRIGLAWQTAMDNSTGHVAELLIEGSNANVTDMTKLLNNYGSENGEANTLCREMMRFEMQNAEALRQYL